MEKKVQLPYDLWVELVNLGYAGKSIYVPKHHPDAFKHTVRDSKEFHAFLTAVEILEKGGSLSINSFRALTGLSYRRARKILSEARAKVKALKEKGMEVKELFPSSKNQENE